MPYGIFGSKGGTQCAVCNYKKRWDDPSRYLICGGGMVKNFIGINGICVSKCSFLLIFSFEMVGNISFFFFLVLVGICQIPIKASCFASLPNDTVLVPRTNAILYIFFYK